MLDATVDRRRPHLVELSRIAAKAEQLPFRRAFMVGGLPLAGADAG